MRVVDIINPTLQKYFGSESGDTVIVSSSKDLDTLGLTPPSFNHKQYVFDEVSRTNEKRSEVYEASVS